MVGQDYAPAAWFPDSESEGGLRCWNASRVFLFRQVIFIIGVRRLFRRRCLTIDVVSEEFGLRPQWALTAAEWLDCGAL